MKNRLFNAFLLLALMGTMFASCKKEYPQPPIQNLPIGTVYTIQDILNMSTGTVFDTASVYGIVTADEVSGNLYKMCFIQDRATGAAIELKLTSTSGVRIGDSIRVYLKDVLFEKYHNLPQLSGFGPDGHIIILANNKQIEPKTVTISDIRSGSYVGALVKIENAEFRLKNVPFCETGEATNRIMDDSTFTNTTDDPNYAEFVVRTSNYANFAFDYMPISKGSIVGIASVYNSTYQLIIRSKSELDFAEWGHPTPVTPVVPGEVQSLPYTQSFDTEFGTYMSYSVLNDDYFWKIDYHTAKMTGFVSQTESHANEDWLISSPVAITGVNDAKMKMVYVGRYFNNINEDVTIWVSSNYTWGSDPTTASWTQVPVVLREASSWSDFLTTEIALTDYVGQTVTIAVKYLSTDTKAGTMEVQSISVEEGTAGGDTPPGPDPGEGEGSGTADDPYNVAAGISQQTTQETAWVKGYIVGAVKSGDAHNSVTSNDDIDWAAPFGRATNVLIADDASCNDIAGCLIVKMPSGSALRTKVNLVDHPDNLGKELLVYGTLKYGFGQPGVDSPGTESDFVFEGGDTPTPPPTPGTEIFSESFASGQGEFTIQDVLLPDELNYVWTHDANYTCMKASAYSGQCYATESWLVSPVIALPTANDASLTIDHAVNKATPTGALFVMISTDYNGDVTTATWTELNLSQWPAGNSWTFVTNATADLTPFVGRNVTIAFKYTSTSSAAATWEIRNFVVKE